MKYFNQVETMAELKTVYKNLAMKFHPDLGGDVEIMKELNNEYDEIFDQLKNGYNKTVKEDRQTTEVREDYRNIILNIINLKDIEIEICGNWIWVSGDTKQYRKELKELKFRWGAKKEMWYWRADDFRVKGYGKKVSMDDIRSKYGSSKVVNNTKNLK